MTITEHLAPILSRPISDEDRKRAALLLLDWTGCAVAARREPAGEKIAATLNFDAGNCTRIGAPKSGPLTAALHNGCLGNVLEMDDVDKRAVLHAAPTVIPAALAAAEHVGAAVKDFLDAIVIGYEATIRIGRAVGPGHYAYWHNTATCGPFGAAAAACHLIKDSDLVSALGLAGTQAAGLWQTRHEPDSMAKQLHAGHAAHAGVLAALLSAQDFQGPRTILEGEQGFFAAMCPGADPEDILADYDEWLIHQTSIKPYPACRHAHAAIDAAKVLHERGVDKHADVLVETYADALKFCDRANPTTSIEAKFSLQYCVGVVLNKGSLDLADFEPDTILTNIDGHVARNIWVKQDPDIQSCYPAHYGAKITVGDESYTADDAYGDPEAPMSEQAVISKAEALMEYAGVNDAQCDALIKAALGNEITAYLEALP